MSGSGSAVLGSLNWLTEMSGRELLVSHRIWRGIGVVLASRRSKLESNAHGDRNKLGVDSSGGSVVIARFEIEAVTGFTYFDGETNSAICTQSP